MIVSYLYRTILNLINWINFGTLSNTIISDRNYFKIKINIYKMHHLPNIHRASIKVETLLHLGIMEQQDQFFFF